MIPPEILTILANGPLALAAIAGLVMAVWMRPRTARVLAAIGLLAVLGHAMWSVLETLLLWDLGLPSLVLNTMSWLSYLVLLAGAVLLVLAATVRPKPTAPSAPGHFPPASPHQPDRNAPSARPAWDPARNNPRPHA
ncbi:hypothetical protein [Halostreptopolyspora alba]|uniref:Uncharacterized protein n=1 Tax=Halostreptopolyspora alba TaxID=2487137 RepID=A0A3N0EBR3_9ACTN|nr:hypothetical protein EFW17_09165 [Nocardiopsaceae bacterium YIM 96095]